MALLTVFAHPFGDRYPAAVMSAFHEPIVAAGHAVDVLDLHAEGFDPRFTAADHAHFWGGPVPDDVAAHQRRVERADRLAFVFPVYWWGMPAMMKGWIERVFTGGWAYAFGSAVEARGRAAPKALLANRPTMLLGIGGSRRSTYDRYGYDDAMRTQLDVGTFAYCGIRDVTTHLLFDVEGEVNAPTRAAGLREVAEVACAFVAPDRAVRDATAEHFAVAGDRSDTGAPQPPSVR